ncbi:MAG: TetR/AcrR family transcriptional regulator [Acidimicrobiales bacterium]
MASRTTTPAASRARAGRPRRTDGAADDDRSTRERVLDAALSSFGTDGYDATSLDDLAAELGIRKQTILYYFPSKADLLDAVIDRSSAEIADVLERAVLGAGDGFARIEAIVRSVFRLAVRRPELLGLLREASRLGPPAATRLLDNAGPLVERATAYLEAGMDDGSFRRCDARLLLVSVYSTIVGVATEVEVLRAVGIEPTLRSTVERRRELLRFLHSALVPDDAPSR